MIRDRDGNTKKVPKNVKQRIDDAIDKARERGLGGELLRPKDSPEPPFVDPAPAPRPAEYSGIDWGQVGRDVVIGAGVVIIVVIIVTNPELGTVLIPVGMNMLPAR